MVNVQITFVSLVLMMREISLHALVKQLMSDWRSSSSSVGVFTAASLSKSILTDLKCLHRVVQDLRNFHHILCEEKSVVWLIRGINYDSLLGKKKMPKCWSLLHTVFEWRCIWGWTVVPDGACIYWKARLFCGAGGGGSILCNKINKPCLWSRRRPSSQWRQCTAIASVFDTSLATALMRTLCQWLNFLIGTALWLGIDPLCKVSAILFYKMRAMVFLTIVRRDNPGQFLQSLCSLCSRSCTGWWSWHHPCLGIQFLPPSLSIIGFRKKYTCIYYINKYIHFQVSTRRPPTKRWHHFNKYLSSTTMDLF